MSKARRAKLERPVYPTWIRSGRIFLFWLLALALVLAGLAGAFVWLPAISVSALAIPFLYIAIVLTWTSHRLGPKGDNVQGKIHQLLIDSVAGQGRLLDVGCGSGQLLIRFAKSAPGDYVGLDYWGSDWEYSRSQAERNAAIENVSGLQFLRGSASKLPFEDANFGRVVSSLTFHEVRDVADKTASVAEAIRVLEPGGRFAFIDLFDDPKFYDGRQKVLDVIARNGGRVDVSSSLSRVLDLRFPLNLAKVLKYAVFVSGTKPLDMGQEEARTASV
ncbi:MAG: class I SAM-dependent methyltransferase [Hyphomonadaceae bacterium]